MSKRKTGKKTATLLFLIALGLQSASAAKAQQAAYFLPRYQAQTTAQYPAVYATQTPQWAATGLAQQNAYQVPQVAGQQYALAQQYYPQVQQQQNVAQVGATMPAYQLLNSQYQQQAQDQNFGQQMSQMNAIQAGNAAGQVPDLPQSTLAQYGVAQQSALTPKGNEFAQQESLEIDKKFAQDMHSKTPQEPHYLYPQRFTKPHDTHDSNQFEAPTPVQAPQYGSEEANGDQTKSSKSTDSMAVISFDDEQSDYNGEQPIKVDGMVVRPSIEDPTYVSMIGGNKPDHVTEQRVPTRALNVAQKVPKLSQTHVYSFKELKVDEAEWSKMFKGGEHEKKYSWADSINYYPGETYEDWEKRMRADCLMPQELIEKATQYAYFIGDLMVDIKKEVEKFVAEKDELQGIQLNEIYDFQEYRAHWKPLSRKIARALFFPSKFEVFPSSFLHYTVELLPEFREFIHHTFVNHFLKQVAAKGGDKLKDELYERLLHEGKLQMLDEIGIQMREWEKMKC